MIYRQRVSIKIAVSVGEGQVSKGWVCLKNSNKCKISSCSRISVQNSRIEWQNSEISSRKSAEILKNVQAVDAKVTALKLSGGGGVTNKYLSIYTQNNFLQITTQQKNSTKNVIPQEIGRVHPQGSPIKWGTRLEPLWFSTLAQSSLTFFVQTKHQEQ